MSNTDSKAAPVKYLYSDYVRTIAALAVILIHSSGSYLFDFDPAEPLDVRWWTGNIYCSLLRWATPFFVLLSGSAFLNPAREETAMYFLRKRAARVLKPFALWTVVYLTYQYRGSFSSGDWPSVGEVLHKIFFEDVYYHLWFLPMIMSLYLLTPTFRIFTRHASRRDVEYFLVLAFAFTAVQHLLPGFFFFKYAGWMGYIGFYVLGYYLSAYSLSPRFKKWLYGIGILMPVVTALGTWLLSLDAGKHSDKLYIYFSPNVALMTMAFYAWLRDYDWQAFAARHPRLGASVHRFATLSFGVYFLHVLVLDVLKNGYIANLRVTSDVFFNLPVHPMFGALLQAAVVALLTTGVIYLLSKIKGAKKWLM